MWIVAIILNALLAAAGWVVATYSFYKDAKGRKWQVTFIVGLFALSAAAVVAWDAYESHTAMENLGNKVEMGQPKIVMHDTVHTEPWDDSLLQTRFGFGIESNPAGDASNVEITLRFDSKFIAAGGMSMCDIKTGRDNFEIDDDNLGVKYSTRILNRTCTVWIAVVSADSINVVDTMLKP